MYDPNSPSLAMICINAHLQVHMIQTIPLNKQYTYKCRVCNLLLIPSLGYIKLNVFVYRLHTTKNMQG
jgi:hypothetical protein